MELGIEKRFIYSFEYGSKLTLSLSRRLDNVTSEELPNETMFLS